MKLIIATLGVMFSVSALILSYKGRNKLSQIVFILSLICLALGIIF